MDISFFPFLFVNITINNYFSIEATEDVEQSMKITISGGQGEGSRKVAREVDMDNYTTVDEVRKIKIDNLIIKKKLPSSCANYQIFL